MSKRCRFAGTLAAIWPWAAWRCCCQTLAWRSDEAERNRKKQLKALNADSTRAVRGLHVGWPCFQRLPSWEGQTLENSWKHCKLSWTSGQTTNELIQNKTSWNYPLPKPLGLCNAHFIPWRPLRLWSGLRKSRRREPWQIEMPVSQQALLTSKSSKPRNWSRNQIHRIMSKMGQEWSNVKIKSLRRPRRIRKWKWASPWSSLSYPWLLLWLWLLRACSHFGEALAHHPNGFQDAQPQLVCKALAMDLPKRKAISVHAPATLAGSLHQSIGWPESVFGLHRKSDWTSRCCQWWDFAHLSKPSCGQKHLLGHHQVW